MKRIWYSKPVCVYAVLILGFWWDALARTCPERSVYEEKTGSADEIMKKHYQGPVVLPCDTMWVPHGDTVVIEEQSSFTWHPALAKRNKAVIVEGTLIGSGEIEFTGQAGENPSDSKWSGIIFDSCSRADIYGLKVRDATFALQVKSPWVSIGGISALESGGILLPDSSLLVDGISNSSFESFQSSDFLPASWAKSACLEATPGPARESAKGASRFWSWTIQIAGLTTLMALEVGLIYLYRSK